MSKFIKNLLCYLNKLIKNCLYYHLINNKKIIIIFYI